MLNPLYVFNIYFMNKKFFVLLVFTARVYARVFVCAPRDYLPCHVCEFVDECCRLSWEQTGYYMKMMYGRWKAVYVLNMSSAQRK